MNNVPKMISTKDLDYLKDMLNWNLIACKKFNHYLNNVQDEEVNKMLKDAADMHATHFETLLNILK